MSGKNLLLTVCIVFFLVSLSVLFGLWDDPVKPSTPISRAAPAESAAQKPVGAR